MNKHKEALLQDLLESMKPVKPEWGRTTLGCGNCDSTRINESTNDHKYKFCPDCGAEIDWGEKDE